MPEGHKLFRLAMDHQPMIGKRIRVSSPQGRFAEEAALLNGKILRKVESFGKHLVYHWSGKQLMHVHLGLYGKFRWQKAPFAEPRGAVRVRAQSKDFGFDLNGPNCCELLSLERFNELVQRIGPDPLRDDANPQAFCDAILKSSRAIGMLLLDQKVVAGIGNIYRSEILFLLGIHPNRPGQNLSKREARKLWTLSKKLLKIGVQFNSIITSDPQRVGKPRRYMNRHERVLIYKKKTCPECSGPVEIGMLANRKVFFCESCQA